MASFVPDDWKLTDKLKQYAKDKGFTDRQLVEQEEEFRLCQFERNIKCWDRCWQRWVLNSIKWGKVVISKPVEYRSTQVELSDEQRKAEVLKFEEQMKRFKRG